MSDPLVTAVMVTGKRPERLGLARLSVRSFVEQDYAAKELLVLNDGPAAVLEADTPGVREVRLEPGRSLGALRNLAFEHARGDWMVQWDDDDWHHPACVSYMMARRRPGLPAFLRWQVRCSVLTGSAYYYRGRATEGVHGTVLHERGVPHRYPDSNRGEDTVFLRKFPERLVLENGPTAGDGRDAMLYVRTYHGWNTWDERHIMQVWAGTDRCDSLARPHRQAVADLRRLYAAALAAAAG